MTVGQVVEGKVKKASPISKSPREEMTSELSIDEVGARLVQIGAR